MWVTANSKYTRYQYHSARVLHLKLFKSLGTFRKASRLTILWIYKLTVDPFSLKTGRVVLRDNNTGALVNTTTLITIPALRILKCNDSSRFFSFSFFSITNKLIIRIWNGKLKLKLKIEIFYAFSTLRIFHTLHFPHSSFSTPRIFYTPRFLHRALCTPRFPPNLTRPSLGNLVKQSFRGYLSLERWKPTFRRHHDTILKAKC